MSQAPSARIHPTAIVSPEAVLAEDVEVGAHVIIEGKVEIGARCVIRPRAILCGPMKMGRGNTVFSGAVLGERPQHMRYADEPTGVEIGENNVFRENVTVHRGTTHSWTTRIGSNNFFMVNSHIAHDCQVGDNCILANGALLGGHVTLENNVFLSGNCAVHQFVRVGRLALLSGCSTTTKDLPPFIIQQSIDTVVGVNVVGMRRAGISNEQITAMRHAYRMLFRQRMAFPAALERITTEYGHLDVIQELVSFVKNSARGINPIRERRPGLAA
jgi:UDP-N-acetylglucosamine acyltransferase